MSTTSRSIPFSSLRHSKTTLLASSLCTILLAVYLASLLRVKARAVVASQWGCLYEDEDRMASPAHESSHAHYTRCVRIFIQLGPFLTFRFMLRLPYHWVFPRPYYYQRWTGISTLKTTISLTPLESRNKQSTVTLWARQNAYLSACSSRRSRHW